jgi:hypothetical protein
MVFPEGVLAIPYEPILRLKTWWDERQNRKGIKEQLLNTLDIYVDDYDQSYKEMSQIGEKELIPLLDSVEVSPTENQINRFLRIYARMLLSLGKIVDSFVDLSRGCKLISINPGFMGDLKEASRFLYDFVFQMAYMVDDNDVTVIDERFYTFLKLYEKEFEGVPKEEVEETVESLKPYVLKTKNVIAPSISRRKFRKKTSRKIVKSFKTLRRKTKNLKIKPPHFKVEAYVPRNLNSITVLLAEISEVEP